MDLHTFRRKAGTAALLGFRRMPGPLKRAAVRLGAPTYTAGAVCVFVHEGKVLFLWQPHRQGWSLPGGLLDRGEEPAEAVRREVAEEIGLAIDPGDPVVVRVVAADQGVDVIFRIRLDERPELSLASEARKAAWIAPGDLVDADDDTRGILAVLADSERPRREGRLRRC
jgi:ADP-ribose pyrophosphatase YjhB (NUDIX family)